SEVDQLPGNGQSVGVHQTLVNGIGFDKRHRVTEAYPPTVGTVDVTGELAGAEVHLWPAGAFEIYPADISAVGIAAQIAQTVLVHAEVVGRKVLVVDLVGRTTATQV